MPSFSGLQLTDAHMQREEEKERERERERDRERENIEMEKGRKYFIFQQPQQL